MGPDPLLLPPSRIPPTAMGLCASAPTKSRYVSPFDVRVTTALQAYMGQLMAPLNAALNKIAKERPAEPLKALAALLAE